MNLAPKRNCPPTFLEVEEDLSFEWISILTDWIKDLQIEMNLIRKVRDQVGESEECKTLCNELLYQMEHLARTWREEIRLEADQLKAIRKEKSESNTISSDDGGTVEEIGGVPG